MSCPTSQGIIAALLRNSNYADIVARLSDDINKLDAKIVGAEGNAKNFLEVQKLQRESSLEGFVVASILKDPIMKYDLSGVLNDFGKSVDNVTKYLDVIDETETFEDLVKFAGEFWDIGKVDKKAVVEGLANYIGNHQYHKGVFNNFVKNGMTENPLYKEIKELGEGQNYFIAMSKLFNPDAKIDTLKFAQELEEVSTNSFKGKVSVDGKKTKLTIPGGGTATITTEENLVILSMMSGPGGSNVSGNTIQYMLDNGIYKFQSSNTNQGEAVLNRLVEKGKLKTTGEVGERVDDNLIDEVFVDVDGTKYTQDGEYEVKDAPREYFKIQPGNKEYTVIETDNVIFKNFDESHIENLSSLEQMEVFAKYFLKEIYSTEGGVDKFKDRLDELMIQTQYGGQKITKPQAKIIASINKGLQIGDGVLRIDENTIPVMIKRRADLLGYKVGKVSIDELTTKLMKLIGGETDEAKFKIGGKEVTFKSRDDALAIIGFDEIYTKAKYKPAGDKKKFLSKLLRGMNKKTKAQVVASMLDGDKEKFDNIIRGIVQGADGYDDVTSLINGYSSTKVEPGEKFVFFDGNKQRLDSMSQEDKATNAIFEQKHRANQIEVGDVDYFDDMGSIPDDAKFIVLPDISLLNWGKLKDWAKANKKILVAGDLAGKKISYGYQDGKLTLRGDKPSTIKEISDGLSAIGVNKHTIDGVYDETITADGELFKGLNFVNFDSTIVNGVDEWNNVSLMTPETIGQKISDFVRSKGYDGPMDLRNNVSLDELKNTYYNFEFAATVEDKFIALNQLKEFYGMVPGGEFDRFAAVTDFLTGLGSEFSSPLTTVKKMINQYTKGGNINPQFVEDFRKANKKPLEDVEDVEAFIQQRLESALNRIDAIKNENVVQVSKTDTSMEAIITGDNDGLNSLRESIKESGKGKAINTKELTKIFNNIARTHESNIEALVAKGADQVEVRRERNRFYQEVDEFEYQALDKGLGDLFDTQDKGRIINGRKFNVLDASSKESLPAFKESIDDMIREFDGTVKQIKDRVALAGDPNSMLKNGVYVQGDIIKTIDDAIMDAKKKVRPGSPIGNARNITRKSLKSLKRGEKIKIYKNILEGTKSDIEVGGAVANILERSSLYLQNIDFFNKYNVVQTLGRWLPKELGENTAKNFVDENVTDFVDAFIKGNIFEKVSAHVKSGKNTFNVKENIKNLRGVVKKSYDESIAELLKDDTLEAFGISPVEVSSFRDGLLAHYITDFNPYGHLTPVDRKTVKKFRDLYGATNKSGKELDSWIGIPNDKKNFSYIDQFPENLTDEGIDAVEIYKAAESEEFRRVREELKIAEGLADKYADFNKSVMDIYARPVMQKYSSLNKIYDGYAAVNNQGKVAVDFLDNLFNKWSSIGNAFISIDAWEDLTQGFLSRKIDLDRLKKSQDWVPRYMSMSDGDFIKASQVQAEGGQPSRIAFEVAEYFRKLRTSLGTNGAGAGPSTSQDVNVAIHNMYEAFMNIGKSGKASQTNNELRSFMGAMQNGNIFKFLGKGQVAPTEWKAALYFDGKDTKIFGEDEFIDVGGVFKNKTDERIEEGNQAFNRLFNSELTRDEYMTVVQGVSGFSVDRLGERIVNYMGSLAKGLTPFYNTIRKADQLGFNVFTSSRGLLAYISYVGGLNKRHTSKDLRFASQLRNAMGHLDEVYDFDLRRFGKELDDEGIAFASGQKQSIWNEINSLYKYEIQDGGKFSTLDGIMQTATDVIRSSRFGRTVELAAQNGQNIVDIIFSGAIKDVSYIEAIKGNRYRPFNSIDEVKFFLKNGDQDEIKRVMNAVESSADRIYNDLMGTNFGALDKPINNRTGFKGAALNTAFLLRDNMSYLNGWGRSKTRSVMKTLNRAYNILDKLKAEPNSKTVDDVIDFVKNTPEFRAYLESMGRDIVNAIRAVRFENDDDEPITMEDYYKALDLVSPQKQALGIVGEMRPILAAVEASIDDKDGTGALEEAYSALTRTMFAEMKINKKSFRFLKELTSEETGIKGAVENLLNGAADGTLRYLMGDPNSGKKIIAPVDYNNKLGVALGSEPESFIQETYYSMGSRRNWLYVTNGDNYSKSAYRILEGLVSNSNLGQTFSQGKRWIEGRGDWTLEWSGMIDGQKVFSDRVYNTQAMKDVREKGYIPLTTEKEVEAFEKAFMWNNPFMSSTSFDRMDGLLNNYISLGKTNENAYEETNMNVQAMNDLFDRVGKDNIKNLREQLVVGYEADLGAGFKKTQAKDRYQLRLKNFLIDEISENRESPYYKVWGQMVETGKDSQYFNLDTGPLKLQDKISYYNIVNRKWSEQNEGAYEDFVYQVLELNHKEEINEGGYEFFKLAENDGDYYHYLANGYRGLAEQKIQISNAMEEGDFEGAKAGTNKLSQYMFIDKNDKNFGEKLAIKARVTQELYHKIDNNDNFSDLEKTALKYIHGKNNIDILENSGTIERATGEKFEDLYGGMIDSLFQFESELNDSITHTAKDALLEKFSLDTANSDTNKGKAGSGKSQNVSGGGVGRNSGGTSGKSGQTAKTTSIGAVKSQKRNMSKALDSYRKNAKSTSSQTTFSPIKFKSPFNKQEINRKYPSLVAAKTKAPSGLSRKSFKDAKDIKRKIKVKKIKFNPPIT